MSEIICKIIWKDDPKKEVHTRVCETGSEPELEFYDTCFDDHIFFYFDGKDPLKHDGEFTVVEYEQRFEERV
jgi:hypothetical protein